MIDVLIQAEKDFDRISNRVRLIRSMRDQSRLNREKLEIVIAGIQKIALEQRNLLGNEIKKLKDEQDNKEHPKIK